jgi:glycosyltransferase involved in cell wall biosynthesis
VRIAHVIPTYAPAYRYGGPIRALEGLAEAQAAAGDEVMVYTTNLDGDRRLHLPLGEPVGRGRHSVRYFPLAPPRRLGRAPRLAAALAAELPRLDLVHLHSVFLWPTWAAARAAQRARRPYVVSPRGMLDPDLVRRRGALRKRLWIALAERRTLAGAARIVATSEAEASAIRRLGLALAPLAVVPNGVDPAEFAEPDPGALAEPVRRAVARGPYVLFLGRLSWKKRIDLLIDAVALGAGARLLVAGPDDERLRARLERQARTAGVAERIDFLGEVGGADRAALLHGATALALVSTAENFGNAALEAMACGVPVVVSPEIGLADEIRRSGCGAVVDADPVAIAAALGELAADPAAARALGERGRRAAESGYGWTAVAARMRAVYRAAGAA